MVSTDGVPVVCGHHLERKSEKKREKVMQKGSSYLVSSKTGADVFASDDTWDLSHLRSDFFNSVTEVEPFLGTHSVVFGFFIDCLKERNVNQRKEEEKEKKKSKPWG